MQYKLVKLRWEYHEAKVVQVIIVLGTSGDRSWHSRHRSTFMLSIAKITKPFVGRCVDLVHDDNVNIFSLMISSNSVLIPKRRQWPSLQAAAESLELLN